MVLNGRIQMNFELQRILMEVVVVESRYYNGICQEGLRKATKNLSWNSQCPS
jgi:hypothetical protein